MKVTSEDEKRRVFKSLNAPDRPINQIAEATRPNTAEKYDSKKLLETADRLFPRGIESAKAVMGIFASRKR